MKVKLEYDPRKYSARANALVLLKAQEWKTTPALAAIRILDEQAAKTKKEVAA